MHSILRKTALAALLVAAVPAQAAIQTWNFSGAFDSGHFDGETFHGVVTFDDAALIGAGSEWLPVSSLKVQLLGDLYRGYQADWQAEVGFEDGAFLGVSASFSNGDPQFSLIPGLFDSSDAFVAYDTALGFSGAGSMVYAPVPEPEAYALMLAGLGLVGYMARRRKLAAGN